MSWKERQARKSLFFCKLCGLKTKEDGNIRMKQLCYPPTPILPINWLHSSTWHHPFTQTRRRRTRGEERKRRESGEEVGSTLSALTRLRRRKWQQLELGHTSEMKFGEETLQRSRRRHLKRALKLDRLEGKPAVSGSRPPLPPPTAEGWEGLTFTLVARDVCALREGIPFQHVQCYVIPDALQGKSVAVPLSF